MSKDSVVRNNLWKWLTLLLIAVGSAYLTLPLNDKIRLGLDLKGGSSFTLSIDQAKLRDMIVEADASLEGKEAEIDKKVAETLEGNDDRIVEIVRRRVDAMGTNEPVIQPIKDKHQIVVQLPGADKATQDAARERLQKMAYLEFHLVPQNEQQLLAKLPANEAPAGFVREGGIYRRTTAETEMSGVAQKRISQFASHVAFSGGEPVRFILQPDERNHSIYHPRFICRRAVLTGGELESAEALPNEGLTPGYKVSFEVKGAAADKFARVTGANIGRQLAIVLDGELLSSPVLKAEIGKSGQITGNFSLQEAKRLASDLNAGALPAPLMLGAESTVDPTVGVDAIARGKWAALIGFALVAVFMIFYYWYLGGIADIALFLDVILLPTALFLVANILGVFVNDPTMEGSKFQLPVLTMPGIAGLVLTLGMAVDANVLIFERIREEFQRNATVGKAVENGYARAFTAIFDSNLTTIITGCILYSVGTGPVRGFAIMLTGGVIISMFTAIVVTRLVIDHTSNPNSATPFKMRQVFTAPKIDFMKYGNKTLLGSAIVILLTLGLFGYRLATNPGKVLAVDLTGGTSIVYSIAGEEPQMGDIRTALEPIDNAMQIQFLSAGTERRLLVKTGISEDSVVKSITEALSAKYGEKTTFGFQSKEMVGSMVGADLRESGTKAVLFSLVAILIYVGFRFRFGFGLGGLVALAHDALISLGIYSLLGHQVSLIVITALLTIIGYSINDTVVVFDRIREQLKLDKRTSFYDLCNQAINACLSRTVITSVTTFFAVAALFIFGEGSIYDFALTMLIGVVAGTYSSIFIATPIMAWWYKGKRPDFDEEESEEKNERA